MHAVQAGRPEVRPRHPSKEHVGWWSQLLQREEATRGSWGLLALSPAPGAVRDLVLKEKTELGKVEHPLASAAMFTGAPPRVCTHTLLTSHNVHIITYMSNQNN